MFNDLTDIKFIGDENVFDKAIELMQKKYYLINRGGKVYILHNDKEDNLIFTEPQSFKTFYKYLNISIPIINTTRFLTKYVVEEFLKSPNTIRLEGIVFNPTLPSGLCMDNKYYNVWCGFTYEPKEGNVHPFLTLLDVNCNGDVDTFNYFLNYLAYCIQFPARNPRTSIAIIGNQGSGKGTLINDTILKLTKNSKKIDNIDMLVGQFNGHLMDGFFIYLDEAFWAGDMAISNKLKTFITEEKRTINEKHKPSFVINSYSKLFISSNNDFIVHVESTDRRYVVLRANDKLKGNFKWFDNYQKWLQSGGYNYIMYYLLNRDISDFNPLNIPATKEKTELQLKSSDLPTKFIYDLLEGNINFNDDMYKEGRIYRKPLYEEFVDYCKKYHPKSYIPSVNEVNKVMVKAFDFDKDKPNWRQNWKDKNGYYYDMPSLPFFQQKFAKNIFNVESNEIFNNQKSVTTDIEDTLITDVF